jgi:hypothetical protein
MTRHVVRRHTDYLPDATALTGRWDQQYTSETTRARLRTWRNALATYLRIRLWCFAACHVPGQTAHVRGFTIRERQNRQENCPNILELYSSHSIARLIKNLSPALFRAFTAVPRPRISGDLHYKGRAKTKATANEVTAIKIGAQIPSDNTDNAISGNSLTRGATLLSGRLDRDFPSSRL